MASLNDTPADFPDVYQLEQTDPVLGGAPNEATGAGMDNIPHLQLARRTRWLKERVDQLLATAGQMASTAVAGIVQLSDSVTSSATDRAATANAVRIANANADSRVPLTREVKGGGLVQGGGALTTNRTLSVIAASAADAVDGTREDVAMTPASTRAVLDTRLAGVAALGVGQAWSDMTAQRQGGVAYTNETGKPILVQIRGKNGAGGGISVQVSADGASWVTVGHISQNEYDHLSFVVPAGHRYRLANAINTLDLWAELR